MLLSEVRVLLGNAKYQITVDSAVYHMLELEKNYQSIGIKDIGFEVLLPYSFYFPDLFYFSYGW